MKETYLRLVQEHLDCPEEERRRLLGRLEKAADAYLAEEPEAADLAAAFGAPADCARELLAECDAGAVAAERKKRRRRSGVVIAVLAVVLALLLGLVIHMWSNNGLVVIETTHYEDGVPEGFPTGGEGQISYHYEN